MMAASTPAPKPTSSPTEGWPSSPPPTVPTIVPMATSEPPARVSRRFIPTHYAVAVREAIVNAAVTTAVREVARRAR